MPQKVAFVKGRFVINSRLLLRYKYGLFGFLSYGYQAFLRDEELLRAAVGLGLADSVFFLRTGEN